MRDTGSIMPADLVGLNGETGVNNPTFPIGCFDRYGAKGNGVADDFSAIQNAMNAVALYPGVGRVFGVPGKIYNSSLQLVPPDNLWLDLTGVTLRPTGTADVIKRTAAAIGVSHTVTAGAQLGSSVITFDSVAGFAAGQILTFTTDHVPTMPWSWTRIRSVNVGALQVTLETPLTFTYAGTVTGNVQSLHGRLFITGGAIDLSAIVSAPLGVVNLSGYDLVAVRNVGLYGPMGSTTTNAGFVLAGNRREYVEDCEGIDVTFPAAFSSLQNAQFARNARLDVDGDTFGTICVACDMDQQVDIKYRGRRKSGSANSIRAVKVSSGRHSTVENIVAADCETVLELFNVGRVQGGNINGVNIGLTAYAGQTAINIAATTADGFMQHIELDGINLENLGGIGIQTSGDATGRITLSNIHVKDCVADGIVGATNNTRVLGAIVENWNTGAVAGAAGIRQTAVGGNMAIDFDGVTFLHTDNTKNCMSLAAGPRNYTLRGITAPNGNPLFDTALGIDPGAQNLSVGSLASLLLATNTSKLAELGRLVTFTLPQNKSMTFTFEPFACHFMVSVSNGKAAEFFADHATAMAAGNIVNNPSGFFAITAAPGAGQMGVSKAATNRTVTIKNNPADGDFDIAILTLGGAITAITDPV